MAPIHTIVAIPTLNEADHIEAAIRSLRATDFSVLQCELWVIDGGSSDGTVEIVERLLTSFNDVRLLHNPDRTQASAINLAADEARRLDGVRYLVRADAHAGYPEGWVARLIKTLEEQDADTVVVPMRTCGGSAMQNASSDLFNSWLGHGGAPHRVGLTRGFVGHGHHALFRLDAFLEAGGYDPRFLANEDAELDVRLRKLGRRIFLENLATVDYVPRNSLREVYRQFSRNGKYRLCTSLKHDVSPGARQLAPIGLCVLMIGSVISGALVHPALFAPAGFYALFILIGACVVASKKTPRRIALIAATAATAHLAFGFGALTTLAGRLRGRIAPFAVRVGMKAEPGNQ